MLRFIFGIFLFFSIAGVCFAQSVSKIEAEKTPANTFSQAVKSSAAFGEILLRQTELKADLEDLLLAYNEEFPKIIEMRLQLASLQKEISKLATVKTSETGKLSLALGKLIIRKAEIETDLWKLRQQYSDEHPEVKGTKRKLEVFEKAIKEILL